VTEQSVTVFRIAQPLEINVQGTTSTVQFAVTLSSAVNVVNRQQNIIGLATTSTFPTVSLYHLCFRHPVVKHLS